MDEVTTLDLMGVAAVITAITTPITLAFITYVNRKVTAINHAVNGKDPRAQTMVSQVDEMHKADFPPEVDNAAILPLVKLLVADMIARNEET